MADLPRVSRVLMTADTVGGVWSYALQLATLLAGRGVEVILATMGREPNETQRQEAAAVPNLKMRVSSFALEWMPDPWDDVSRAGEWLLGLESKESPDVVHLNGYAHGALPFRSPRVIVAHSCVASWWSAVRREALTGEWRRYVDAVRDGLASAQRIAVPTRAMRDALIRCYGVGHDAIVIPNARAWDRWHPRRKEPFVLAAGRAWDPAKNIAALDAVAAGLPWPVMHAGETEGPFDRGAQPLEHVQALGAQDAAAMASLMGRAAIFAHPARYEPFGLSVLEAALSGCALVLGDIDTLRENWAGAARFVSPDDSRGLRDVLLDLIGNAGQREALAAAARRRAELFSPEQHRDRYYELYAQLMSGQHQRGAVTPPAAAPSSTVLRA
jgi:glycogen(starch) synthase